MIEQVLNKIKLIIGRCSIKEVKEDFAKIELLAGEKRSDVDFIQHYGFSSRPKGNCDGLAVFVGGSRSNGVVIASKGIDILQQLEEGEVCVHSPYGQKILLKKDGNIELFVENGKKIKAKGDFELDGEFKASGEVVAMSNTTKIHLSTHLHPTPTGPSSSPTPNT